MIPSLIQFHGFEITEPDVVLRSQTQNKSSYWPADWTIVAEKNDEIEINIFQWLRKNCFHKWDVETDSNGRRIFAFEDDGEATLFLLRF
jgi:hypothetical protein